VSQERRNDFLCALLVGAAPESRQVALDVFRAAGWRLYQARDRKSALECLDRHSIHVVLVNADCPGWSWKQALQDLHGRQRPPQLLVTSRLADESLWAEVLNYGGYDVLTEPFDRDEVERVIASARRHYDPPVARAARAQAAAAAS